MKAQNELAGKQWQQAMDRYNERYNNRTYQAATAGKSVKYANALTGEAMALCGCPYYKLSNRQWSEAALAHLANFVDGEPEANETDITKQQIEAEICDKCGKSVPSENSALRLAHAMYGDDTFSIPLAMSIDRHIYPTATCEGSPSRVRSIENNMAWATAYRGM